MNSSVRFAEDIQSLKMTRGGTSQANHDPPDLQLFEPVGTDWLRLILTGWWWTRTIRKISILPTQF
jgi:hypothetical protein